MPITKQTVTPVEAVVQRFRKYADFGGRATRAPKEEYMPADESND